MPLRKMIYDKDNEAHRDYEELLEFLKIHGYNMEVKEKEAIKLCSEKKQKFSMTRRTVVLGSAVSVLAGASIAFLTYFLF